MVNGFRKALIVANWKMYKGLTEMERFFSLLAPLTEENLADLWFALPFVSIDRAHKLAVGTPWKMGAQNMNDASEGAFTGEVAAKMLVEAGASFVLLGHSERRRYFYEDNAFINRKVKRALDAGLIPLLCIGENLNERSQGEMEDVLATQMSECLTGISEQSLHKLVIAYEPIWAIGTGIPASPEDAQRAHAFCREYLAQHWGEEIAAHVPLLYGGSVQPDNAGLLLAQPDIDGLLVGGASLDAEKFAAVAHSAVASTPPLPPTMT